MYVIVEYSNGKLETDRYLNKQSNRDCIFLTAKPKSGQLDKIISSVKSDKLIMKQQVP